MINVVLFNWPVQDFDLGKNLKPRVDELAEFVNHNNESYNTPIENILSCNICHFYKYLGNVNGYASECRPFDYCYYYHGYCLEDWKLFHLKQNDGLVKQSNCSCYRCHVRDVFDNLYACEWTVDGSMVQSPIETMIKIVNLDNSEDIEETDPPN